MSQCWAPSAMPSGFDNDTEDHSALAATLQPLGVALVVIESHRRL